MLDRMRHGGFATFVGTLNDVQTWLKIVVFIGELAKRMHVQM
jgi:hypothetical protein